MIEEVRNKIESTAGACLALSDIVDMLGVYADVSDRLKNEIEETLKVVLENRGKNDEAGTTIDKIWKIVRGTTTEESTINEFQFLLKFMENLNVCCKVIDEYMTERNQQTLNKMRDILRESLSGQN